MKKIVVQVFLLSFAFAFFSCVSSPKTPSTPHSENAEEEKTDVKEENAVNPESQKKESDSKVTEIPHLNFLGGGIKIECEKMFLSGAEIVDFADASGQKAIRFSAETDSASAKVTFPAGRYEGLVSELAPDSEHSAFYVFVEEDAYRVYPSDPPLGFWELTTRVPIYFDLENETEILIKIQPNSKNQKGGFGMNLDFIQFAKIK